MLAADARELKRKVKSVSWVDELGMCLRWSTLRKSRRRESDHINVKELQEYLDLMIQEGWAHAQQSAASKPARTLRSRLGGVNAFRPVTLEGTR